EVIRRHTAEPVRPPEQVVSDYPHGLSAIVLKALAKNPDERYADCGELIEALEDFLGQHGVEFRPGEEHAAVLERGAKAFVGAPAARVRSLALLGYFGACAALFVLLLLLGYWVPAGGALGLGVLTAAAYFVVHGLTYRTFLFRKAREVALGSGVLEWVKVG